MKHIHHSLRKLFVYCNIESPTRFMNFVVLSSLAASIAISVIILFAFSLPASTLTIIAISIYGILLGMFYLWLNLKADKIAREVETALPDALQLMAMNLKAGMTTERAILMATHHEFGPLERELTKVSKQVLSGKDIKDALLEMTERVRSSVLHRTVSILAEGIEAGGELSDLLNKTAEDLRNQRLIQQEIQANVMMYAIFIFFAAGIGAPLLYSISTFLVDVLGKQFARFDVSQTAAAGVTFFRGRINLSSNFLLLFSFIALLITSVFSSLIIGIIKSGREKDGLKFIPIMILVSFVIFIAVRIFVANMLKFA